MSVKVTGMDALRANLAKFADATGNEVAGALLAGGKLVETEAKKLIAAQSSGDTVARYRSGGNGYSHVASAAGDAPNTDTGNLIGSIQTEAQPDGVYVGTAVEYAPWLEFGTVVMKPRPFLYPAYKRKREKIMALAANGVADAIRRSSEGTL